MTAADRKGDDEFRLIISLTGICLYLWSADRSSVTFVMPDARRKKGVKPPKHPDGSPTVPHAGYLRFDLKNLHTGVEYMEPAPDVDDRELIPTYEVVHRFQREELVLNLPDGEPIEGKLNLPDASEFAPVRQPISGLEDRTPPEIVLMRTRLVGGSFRTATENLPWKIDGDLREDDKTTRLSIGGAVTWERTLRGTGMDIVLSRFDGGGVVKIPLRALRSTPEAVPEIRLKIANLCGNPLEWPELDVPPEPVPDLDFKWLYTLLEPRPGFDGEKFPKYLCPVPEPVLGAVQEEGDLQDCFGVQVTPKP